MRDQIVNCQLSAFVYELYIMCINIWGTVLAKKHKGACEDDVAVSRKLGDMQLGHY